MLAKFTFLILLDFLATQTVVLSADLGGWWSWHGHLSFSVWECHVLMISIDKLASVYSRFRLHWIWMKNTTARTDDRAPR